MLPPHATKAVTATLPKMSLNVFFIRFAPKNIVSYALIMPPKPRSACFDVAKTTLRS
jgi:hypothetical protein